MGKSYMHYARSFWYNFANYGIKLSGREIRETIISIIIIAFILSFREWGDETFNFVTGITNFGIALVFTAIAMIVNQLGQRIIATYYGYDPEYNYSLIGLMISIVIAFASRGSLILFMPGYVILNQLAASRLGEFRYYVNQWEWAKVCFAGPLFNFMLMFFLSLFHFKEIFLLKKLMLVNMWFAIFSLLPVPYNPGMYMFFAVKYILFFAIGFIIGGSLLIFFTTPVIAIIGSLLIGTATMSWYFFSVDKKP